MSHWTKIDHITFLLMLPFMIPSVFHYSFMVIATVLWWIAFIYDLYEAKKKKEKV